jgi:hypothetical protein
LHHRPSSWIIFFLHKAYSLEFFSASDKLSFLGLPRKISFHPHTEELFSLGIEFQLVVIFLQCIMGQQTFRKWTGSKYVKLCRP